MKYMVYFIHYEELYIFLAFNRKKLQQLRNILIYIQDRNSIQIIKIKEKDWISRGWKFFYFI